MKIPEPVQLPSGRWRVQVLVDGKRVGKTFETAAEAIYWAGGIKVGAVEYKKDAKPKRLKLKDAISQYIDDNKGILSPSTIRGYTIIKDHRFSDLMSVDVKAIDKATLQRAITKEAQTVSAKTVVNAYGLVRTVLAEHGITIPGIKLPQRKKPRKKYLQPEELGALMKAAEGDECETEILIAATLGLRRSEIIGMCWDCVDLEAGTITVSRAYVPDENHKFVLKDTTKNESSQRTLECPDFIIEKLKAIYKPTYAGKALRVFQIHPDTLRKHIHSVCAAAGITDTTVHGLRHTNAALMRMLGIADDVAMERGGWKTESTYKQTYSYVFDQRKKDAADAMGDFFSDKLHTKLHTDE